MATAKLSKDWDVLELDPTQEIQGHTVVRKFDRKLQEFVAAQVAFFRTLILVVECILPNCAGHQKYGVAVEENIPVVFNRHEKGHQAIYTTYKNPISKPLRVPENGDNLLVGIKWRATDLTLLVEAAAAIQNVFDCLLADLRFRMLTKDFCLECLFAHTNGRGLFLERFIKTVLYHIVPFGRMKDKEGFVPLRKYIRSMEIKFKRIHWGHRSVKIYCDPATLTEHCLMGTVERPLFASNLEFEGYFVDPQTGLLRNMDSVTKINLIVKCYCLDGKPRPYQAYGGLMRKIKPLRGGDVEFNISVAEWNVKGSEYEDPLWSYSMLGPPVPTQFLKKTLAEPVARVCPKCNSFRAIQDTQVPDTTWFFMADLSEDLRKTTVNKFQGITSYQLGGVVFAPAFVMLYNVKNARFTTMNLLPENEWRFFDDQCGGTFRHTDPSKTKYNDRVNLRVCFYRKTGTNPHPCVYRATRAL
jgi:hypothetical protein